MILAASLAAAILLPSTTPRMGLSAVDETVGSRWRSDLAEHPVNGTYDISRIAGWVAYTSPVNADTHC